MTLDELRNAKSLMELNLDVKDKKKNNKNEKNIDGKRKTKEYVGLLLEDKESVHTGHGKG